MGVDVEGVVRALRGGDADDEAGATAGEDVSARLGRNAELIAQVGRAQVVRLRRAARARPASTAVAVDAAHADEAEGAKKGGEADEEEELTKAGTHEKEDGASALFRSLALSLASCPRADVQTDASHSLAAAALLSSLTSLLSAHSSTRSGPSSSPASGAPPSTPSLLPPRTTLRTLTPLLLAARTSPADAVYAGTLDEVNYRALREAQLAASAEAAGEGMGDEHVADLKVEG